ncbi:MAG: hypothetical protein COT73_02645 [Bdellovibrio sp. CG10_big_fil_rev_8_21_14_0_10_47_8]|nr:MAG: hypothetical protein COT73_02645 [Bdellovibrio sp. CG10_big_fil_rev_8_21_14_0_10_47_8]
MQDSSDSGTVKKVAPYPFSVVITDKNGGAPLRGQVVKLTDFGFLMKVEALHFYQVGQNYHVEFSIPVMHMDVLADVKVMKTYDAFEAVSKVEKAKLYTVEMHFLNLPTDKKQGILQFLQKIGQKNS